MNGREAMCWRDDLLGADHTSRLQFHLVPFLFFTIEKWVNFYAWSDHFEVIRPGVESIHHIL